MVAAMNRDPETMRLARYLAHAGVASRRAAEGIIAERRVSVDGVTVTDPALGVGEASEVLVDGRRIAGPEPRATWALNKPAGVISAASDPRGRKTVIDLIGPVSLRLYPVGRLDYDSSGLILLTNDGELANLLTHPRFEVPKTYRVRLASPIDDAALSKLRSGVQLEDGPTAPATVRRREQDEFEITIREGRNRQIRRMCAAVGSSVVGLTRVAFGPLKLGGLAPGAARRLSEADLTALREAAL